MQDLTFLKNERNALLSLIRKLAEKGENLDLCIQALHEIDFFYKPMTDQDGVSNRFRILNCVNSLIGMTEYSCEEEWKPVVGQEGKYEVSCLGRVKSLDHYRFSKPIPNQKPRRPTLVKGKIEPIDIGSSGYLCVGISSKRKNVHNLVAEAFLGPRPNGMFILHNDGNKRNARLSNLRYGTQSENIADSKAHGTHKSGEQISSAQMCNMSAAFVKAMTGTWSHRKMALAFGVSKPTISYASRGIRFIGSPKITKEEAINWFIDQYGEEHYINSEAIIDTRKPRNYPTKVKT